MHVSDLIAERQGELRDFVINRFCGGKAPTGFRGRYKGRYTHTFFRLGVGSWLFEDWRVPPRFSLARLCRLEDKLREYGFLPSKELNIIVNDRLKARKEANFIVKDERNSLTPLWTVFLRFLDAEEFRSSVCEKK